MPKRSRRVLCVALVLMGLAVMLLGVVSLFEARAILGAGMLLVAIGGALWPDPAGRGSRIPGIAIAGFAGLLLLGAEIGAVPRHGPVLFFGGLMLLPLGVGLLLGELRRLAPQGG